MRCYSVTAVIRQNKAIVAPNSQPFGRWPVQLSSLSSKVTLSSSLVHKSRSGKAHLQVQASRSVVMTDQPSADLRALSTVAQTQLFLLSDFLLSSSPDFDSFGPSHIFHVSFPHSLTSPKEPPSQPTWSTPLIRGRHFHDCLACPDIGTRQEEKNQSVAKGTAAWNHLDRASGRFALHDFIYDGFTAGGYG